MSTVRTSLALAPILAFGLFTGACLEIDSDGDGAEARESEELGQATQNVCDPGTYQQAACTFGPPIPSTFDATLAAPTLLSAKTVNSTSSYGSTTWCSHLFTVRLLEGNDPWSRIAARPRSSITNECDCVNTEVLLQVRGLRAQWGCEGGCSDCSEAEYCADPESCYYCNWNPFEGPPLVQVVTERVTGQWNPASGTCSFPAFVYRDDAPQPFDGFGAMISAGARNKITRARLPVTIEARRSPADPNPPPAYPDCPACP